MGTELSVFRTIKFDIYKLSILSASSTQYFYNTFGDVLCINLLTSPKDSGYCPAFFLSASASIFSELTPSVFQQPFLSVNQITTQFRSNEQHGKSDRISSSLLLYPNEGPNKHSSRLFDGPGRHPHSVSEKFIEPWTAKRITTGT